MAQHRPADGRLSVEEVIALVDERFPDVDHDQARETWGSYVSRCQVRRAKVRALAHAHGYSAWDLFLARWHPDSGTTSTKGMTNGKKSE